MRVLGVRVILPLVVLGLAVGGALLFLKSFPKPLTTSYTVELRKDSQFLERCWKSAAVEH